MTDDIEILLEMDSSGKILSLSHESLVYKVEKEIRMRQKKESWPIFYVREENSHNTKINVFILQQWNPKWEGYVGATDVDQVNDGEQLMIIAQKISQCPLFKRKVAMLQVRYD